MALISWSVDFLQKLFEISPPSCPCKTLSRLLLNKATDTEGIK